MTRNIDGIIMTNRWQSDISTQNSLTCAWGMTRAPGPGLFSLLQIPDNVHLLLQC